MSSVYDKPCNLCGKTNFILRHKGNIGDRATDRFSQYAWYNDIYKCLGCGLVVEKLEHTDEEIFALISDERYLDEAIGSLNLAEKYIQFEMLLKIVADYSNLREAQLLDVGANTGIFMDTARKHRAIVDGLEPSREACAAAERYFGLKVRNNTTRDAGLNVEAYDLITMWDVVEHLYDPKDELTALLPALKRGGKIFISTHDIESMFARLTGRHYPMLMYQHLFHFSKRTLEEMLEQCGYNVLVTRSFYKSWTLPYVLNLAEKNWPGSVIGQAGQCLATLVSNSKLLSKIRLVMPLREFFVIVAERPS